MAMESKVFSAKLGAFVRSTSTQRDNLQDLILAGIELYMDSGNTVYLTKVMNACIGVRSLPTKVIKAYIQDHANVSWSKAKDGQLVFKKIGKEVEVTWPVVVWYDPAQEKKDQAKPDLDMITTIKALRKKLEKALESHTVKEGQEELAVRLLEDIKTLTA